MVRLKTWRTGAGLEGGEVNVSDRVVAEANANVGAEIMGRGKFGPATRGPWGDDPWRGWWGEDPPFHKPVFVLTHYERDPLVLSDTTFTFVTDGIDAALQQAREAAGDKDVFIGGGADVVNQYLAAGLVNELELHVTPILLGGGARLFEESDLSEAGGCPDDRGAGRDPSQISRREVLIADLIGSVVAALGAGQAGKPGA